MEYIMTKRRIFVTIGVLAAFIAITGLASFANKNNKSGSGTTIQQGGTGTSNSPSPRPVTTSTTSSTQ